MDKSLADFWEKTPDLDSFKMARKIIKEEGILCGGSSGSNVLAAVNFIKRNGINNGERFVIILPDCVRYYFDKFINDQYMVDKKLFHWKELHDDKHPLANYPISQI